VRIIQRIRQQYSEKRAKSKTDNFGMTRLTKLSALQ